MQANSRSGNHTSTAGEEATIPPQTATGKQPQQQRQTARIFVAAAIPLCLLLAVEGTLSLHAR